MHIGSYVQKKDSKATLGVITGRAPIYNCWEVRWTSGSRRGLSSIVQETKLVLAR